MWRKKMTLELIPKPRPRSTKKGVIYMPSEYTRQLQNIQLLAPDAPDVEWGDMIFVRYSVPNRRGRDVDNAIGTPMDALWKSADSRFTTGLSDKFISDEPEVEIFHLREDEKWPWLIEYAYERYYEQLHGAERNGGGA